MYGHHLHNRPCVPWWFDTEPHIAADGRVYCPHCTLALGRNIDAAKARRAIHTKQMCDGWAASVRDRVKSRVDEGLPPLFAL
jgi:hypothetical protein